MKYLIDGYNLLGHIRNISFQDADKEKRLIAFLAHRKGDRKVQLKVIFDGKNPYFEMGYNESIQGIQIRFTAHDQIADALIIEKDFRRKW